MTSGKQKDAKPSTILVVEDEPDTRAVIVHTLSSEGYAIVEAVDGQEAIERCSESLPDFILTDIMMPRVDGREFIRWFRESFSSPFVPILVLTALTQIDEKVEGLDLGADDYLCKPFNFRELRARVSALLRVKRLTEMLDARTKQVEQANRELSDMQEVLIRKERQLVAAQLAGAAAHNLGQPITTILLNCKIIESAAAGEEGDRTTAAVESIKNECKEVKDILDRMKLVDPEATENYIGETSILSLKDEG